MTQSGTPAIEARHLQKSYTAGGEIVWAVAGIDLTVSAGEIYALLGPNGAGKTTTIAMLTTLLAPTGGTARVAGFDVAAQPDEVRRRIGVTFQEVVLDQELTGRQVLDFHGRLYGMRKGERRAKIEQLAALVELADVLERKAARYSGGMKRRLELARGLMSDPAVLFLDEPTQGLDPQNRTRIWDYIRRLRAEQGMTILLTTHYMEEAAVLADRVGIIDGGKLVVEGAPGELVRAMGADVLSLVGEGDAQALLEALDARSFVQHTTHHAGDGVHRVQVGVDHGERRLAEVVTLAADARFHIHEIGVARPTLADVFLAYTGRELRDE